MKASDRQGTGSASAVLSVPTSVETISERAAAFSWEEWFRHASAQQRAAALGLAHQQGLLYPHQLPATTNGVSPATAAPPKETAVSSLLTRLLAGKVESLLAPLLDPLAFFDTDLDELQQQAVRRALGTPDVFLLEGLPGAGKSRVVAEIILQAAAQGRRVLFLAAHVASLDVVLERLVACPEILALRFLDALEKNDTLPAWLRKFTLEEQKQAFLERVLNGARGNRDEVESVCRQRRDEEPLWAGLQTCLIQCHALAERRQGLADQLLRLGEVVERDADSSNVEGPFKTHLAELRQAREQAVHALDATLQTHREALGKCDAEAATLTARIVALEPGYRAKKHKRFWVPAFWANLFNGQIIPETETLLDQQAHLQARRQEAAQEIAKLEARGKQRRDQWALERAALVAAETEARRQAMCRVQETLAAEASQLEDQWNHLCRRLDVGVLEKTCEALASAQQAWMHKKQQNEDHCQFAHQWAKFVEETGPQMATRLSSFANVLAGTIPRLHADAKFRDAAALPAELVVIEDADTLTDADVRRLSRHGQRCVLVGQALTETSTTNLETTGRAVLAPVAWRRLWSGLGGDADAWPCTWKREDGRLVCQLMPLSADDRQHLEREGLADAPDIDLCILHRPHTRPCLAQVTFSPACSFADAFRFMMREVQEFPLEPHGRTAWWCEDASRVVRQFAPSNGGVDDCFDIEPGVRLAAVDGTRVARIEFDKALGWDRAKAHAWLHRHRPGHDCERTAFLQSAHRYQGPLGTIVKSLIRTDAWLRTALTPASHDGRHFEFVSVPSLQKPDWPREGAGLELDLSASRHADRLPTGLRHGLPARGFVNYLEAQALIRRLEAFLQKDVNGHPCRVAVLALYDGQVELLRRLVSQSEALRCCRVPLEIALPTQLHQREFDVVLLSLTRSHGHRAVPFGEDARELPLALTRARARLMVFGDPGTLSKRIHSTGALDHLDAHAARQELVRLSRLVAFLQNQQPALAHANGKQ